MGKRGPKPGAKAAAAKAAAAAEGKTTVNNEVDEKTYLEFMASIANTKGTLDGARIKNANAWKEADRKNIHAFVAKLMLKLRGMDDIKRNDFLRAWDVYLAYENFDRADMIDAAEEAAAAEAQAAENEEIRETEIEERREAAAEAAVDRGFEETADSFAIDGGEDALPDEIDEEEIKEEGRQAALRGEKINTSNPYDSDEAPEKYDAWKQGAEEIFNQGRFGENKPAEAEEAA